jgi:hypothetical protein
LDGRVKPGHDAVESDAAESAMRASLDRARPRAHLAIIRDPDQPPRVDGRVKPGHDAVESDAAESAMRAGTRAVQRQQPSQIQHEARAF